MAWHKQPVECESHVLGKEAKSFIHTTQKEVTYRCISDEITDLESSQRYCTTSKVNQKGFFQTYKSIFKENHRVSVSLLKI